MTPVSDREKFTEGRDMEVQCEGNTIDMDNTLDLYLEDLREANKQADLRKVQMEYLETDPVVADIEVKLDDAPQSQKKSKK